MAGFQDKTQNMISSLGAIQTLVENFPMNLISFDKINFSTSFDVLGILFKIFNINREELIDTITKALNDGMSEGSNKGFIATSEEIIKMALELNIINILNCATNPIISNSYFDSYKDGSSGTIINKGGSGITLSIAEIDMNGVLRHNPCSEEGKKFYFDVDDYNVNDVYQSKDFNAYLWWIINKGTSEHAGSIWDDRYRANLYGSKKNGEPGDKKLIKCSYIDDAYPKNDSIIVHICGDTYHNTRRIKSMNFNKTIFEFNHDFISSIKLFEPKVIIAEIVEYLLGSGNMTVNLGLSYDEMITQQKINQIIDKVIKTKDTEINDCFFSFSNDEFNEMIETATQKRFGVINTGTNFVESKSNMLLDKLTGITNTGELERNKTIIKDIITEVSATPAKDPEVSPNFSLNYDWQFELMRMLAYPFIRPLFSPKVLFLLVMNKKIMGNIDEMTFDDIEEKFSNLLNGLFAIIKDIIIKLKDKLIELFMNLVMDKLKPLLELFALRLLAETLKMYKDLLNQLLTECLIWFDFGGKITGAIDDVNYADITPSQVEPEQSIC